MQKKLTRLMSLLLCLVIVSGAVACSGEKGASGQKVAVPEVQQAKSAVTHGKDREKTCSSQQCAPEPVVVENNALSEAADYLATGKKPEDRYRDAQNQLKDAVDEFREKNCAGLDAGACRVKMESHRDELLKGFGKATLDFVPVVGTIKTFAEAESALDYLYAAATIIPGERIASGILKSAEKALARGDVTEASKLINKASNEVGTAKYFGQNRKFWSTEPVQFKGNKVYQRNDLFNPNAVDARGRTNIQRMEKGLAPLDANGQSINLHHMLQKQDGPIAEVTQSFHTDNRSIIHINDNSIPSGINRPVFNKWRSDYWKQRANDFKK